MRFACIGIGGIGVSSLAQLLHARGDEIWGCDDGTSVETLRERLKGIHIVSSSDTFPPVDICIYSDAVPTSHPWRIFAHKNGIPTFSYFSYLGTFSQFFETWALAGTHGKSSTTALAGLITESAGYDPRVIVGTHVTEWKTNARIGTGPLIVEADEYLKHFLNLSPVSITINNIEEDHMECFDTSQDLVETFKEFVTKESVRLLCVNGDDSRARSLLSIAKDTVRCGGFSLETLPDYTKDFWLTAINVEWRDYHWKVDFVWRNGVHQEQGTFTLPSPGKHMVMNALSAMATVCAHGIPWQKALQPLRDFKGTWRRCEIVYQDTSKILISDYGHHPTAIATTIEGLRIAYPDADIILIYEPHQKKRMSDFVDDFITTLSSADKTVLLPIYEPKGREEPDNVISSEEVVHRAKEPWFHARDYSEAEKWIVSYARLITKKTIFLVMGAGPVDRVARRVGDIWNTTK